MTMEHPLATCAAIMAIVLGAGCGASHGEGWPVDTKPESGDAASQLRRRRSVVADGALLHGTEPELHHLGVQQGACERRHVFARHRAAHRADL
jgi:hypothetical protein